jgi:broad specificity phosphatase PhoE
MLCKFLLIRHAEYPLIGHTLAGRDDGIRLSETGRDQARGLARSLLSEPLICIQSSPRLRCLETAEALAEAFDLPVLVESALDEVDFGRWSGLDFTALETDPDWHLWNSDRSRARAPGGETMSEAQARILCHIERTTRRYRSGTVAVITHAEIIRAAWLHHMGRPLDEWRSIAIAPASVTALEYPAVRMPEMIFEAAAS